MFAGIAFVLIDSGIENAFHALALDEYRHPFTPTLFFQPDEMEDDFLHRDDVKKINIQQCWFPGVHTNVGGGYPDQHLADLTLAWMVDRCSSFLDFDWKINIPMRLGLHHQPNTIVSSIRDKAAIEQKKQAGGKDKIDRLYPGYALGQQYDSYHDGIMPLLWWEVRTPGEYVAGGVKSEEKIHKSVRERWQNYKDEKGNRWLPDALKGFEPKQVNRPGEKEKWQWIRPGKPATLWSSEIKAVHIDEEEFTTNVDSFEWKLWDHEGHLKSLPGTK